MVGTEKILEGLNSIILSSRVRKISPFCSEIAADIWLKRVKATSDRSGQIR